MNQYYDDLLKFGEPQWFDEHAVPRFCDFEPDLIANIYADEAALVEIACQACQRKFKVAFSRGTFERRILKQSCLANAIRKKVLHYGDPPNVRCCPAGPTMNCDDLQVLQYWQRDRNDYEWKRVEEYEIRLDD